MPPEAVRQVASKVCHSFRAQEVSPYDSDLVLQSRQLPKGHRRQSLPEGLIFHGQHGCSARQLKALCATSDLQKDVSRRRMPSLQQACWLMHIQQDAMLREIELTNVTLCANRQHSRNILHV